MSKVSSTENGLKVYEQVQVALPGTDTPYGEGDIGVANREIGGKTIYLAGFQDDSGEQGAFHLTLGRSWGALGRGVLRDSRPRR